jgi:hypothetical protein
MLPHPATAFQGALRPTRKAAQQIVIFELGDPMQVDHDQREQAPGT